MATQAIRFNGPPGQTITLDVFTLASDTAVQSALVCTEETNRKGLYVTANFVDTLAGRHFVVKKISGTAIGNDFVTLLNADATYDSEGLANLELGATNAATAATEVVNNSAAIAEVKAKTDLIGTVKSLIHW